MHKMCIVKDSSMGFILNKSELRLHGILKANQTDINVFTKITIADKSVFPACILILVLYRIGVAVFGFQSKGIYCPVLINKLQGNP